MLDISMFLDFYFTKYLFVSGGFYGVCQLVRLLVMRKKG